MLLAEFIRGQAGPAWHRLGRQALGWIYRIFLLDLLASSWWLGSKSTGYFLAAKCLIFWCFLAAWQLICSISLGGRVTDL
jgi:hypothetical protein